MQPLKKPFQTPTNKVRGKILLKKSSCVFLPASLSLRLLLWCRCDAAWTCICVYKHIHYVSIQHEEDEKSQIDVLDMTQNFLTWLGGSHIVWEVWSSSPLPLPFGALFMGVIEPVRILSLGKKKLFNRFLRIIIIPCRFFISGFFILFWLIFGLFSDSIIIIIIDVVVVVVVVVFVIWNQTVVCKLIELNRNTG